MYLRENDFFEERVITKFKRLIYVLVAEIVADNVFVLLEGKETLRELLYFLKAGELFMNPIVAFLVFDVFYDEALNRKDKMMRRIWEAMNWAVAANGVLLVIGFFTGIVFRIDTDNVYYRGDWMFLYILILIATVSMLVYGMMRFANRTQGTLKRTLLMFTLILGVGIFLRLILPHQNYDFLCLSVAITFLLIYYSHVTLRIDPLTQLLNRLVYEVTIDRINYTTAIIEIDVNKFKEVNDTYGHGRGDKALKQLAFLIRKTYGEQAYCFRQGGDEFCAILKPGAFDELVDESLDDDPRATMDRFMERLDTAIAEQLANMSESKRYLRNGVSQGCGIYYSGGEMTVREVVKLADDRMYEKKEALVASADSVVSLMESD